MRCRRIRLSRLIHSLKSNCQMIESFVDICLVGSNDGDSGRMDTLSDTPPPELTEIGLASQN